MADVVPTPPNMSPRYDRLIGSLAKVDGEMAAELDQGTVLVSSTKQGTKPSYVTTRKKAGVPRQSPRRHTAPISRAAPAARAEDTTAAQVDLAHLEKAKELRDLAGAKRRHERLLYGLSRREQDLLQASKEADEFEEAPRERIRDRRQREHEQERAARSSAGVDSQLTPRQQQLVGGSVDLAPGSYASTAVCFKCGLPGHAGSGCVKPSLGPKQLRTTQVMLKQRAADKPLPPDAAKSSPLHIARSPRVARAAAAERVPQEPAEAPKARVPMEKEAIQKEIERLRIQLDEVVARETMYDAVSHIQVRTHATRWLLVMCRPFF